MDGMRVIGGKRRSWRVKRTQRENKKKRWRDGGKGK